METHHKQNTNTTNWTGLEAEDQRLLQKTLMKKLTTQQTTSTARWIIKRVCKGLPVLLGFRVTSLYSEIPNVPCLKKLTFKASIGPHSSKAPRWWFRGVHPAKTRYMEIVRVICAVNVTRSCTKTMLGQASRAQWTVVKSEVDHAQNEHGLKRQDRQVQKESAL